MATISPLRPTDPVDAAVPLVAVGLLVAWSADIRLTGGVSTASLTVLASAPVWVSALRAYRWANGILLLLLAALANGAILALAKSVSLPYSVSVGAAQSLHLIGGLGGIGLILWARRFLSIPRIAIVVGTTSGFVWLIDAGASGILWKHGLAIPVTLIALGLLDRARIWLAIAALAGLSLFGMVNDHRSYVGICVLTAGLLLFQDRRSRTTITWGHRLNWIALGVSVLAALYFLGTALLVQGALGEDLQDRSQEQIERGGSLVGGGRPEWTGTMELARAQPEGFGLGAIPTYSDVWTARAGLVRVGVAIENGYVDNYMFGGEFKLHSVTADLWAQCGVSGLLLAIALIASTAASLVDRFATGTATPVLSFLGVNCLWNMAFSPIYTSLPSVGLAVGLLLLAKPGEDGLQAATTDRSVQPSGRRRPGPGVHASSSSYQLR